jgi:hypothetical protein
MSPAEMAAEMAAQIIEEVSQMAVLPIPLVDLENLEDKIKRIIHDGLTSLSCQAYVPVVLHSTGENASSVPLSNVRRSRHWYLVWFALRMRLPQELEWPVSC